MITTIKKPKQEAVFLSGNSIILEVSSDLQLDYYFKLEILVEDEVFNDFVLGKYSSTSAKIDLKNIFENLFSNEFTQYSLNGLHRLDNLIKRVTLKVSEIQVIDEQEVSSVFIPDFYVFYSNEEKYFNHSIDLQKLSTYSGDLTIQPNSIVQFPLWLLGEDVTLDITNKEEIVYSDSYSNLSKGPYCFYFDFSSLNETYDNLFLEFKTANKTFIQKVVFKKQTLYPTTSIYIQNSFLAYEYFELFGRKQESIPFKRKTLKNYDNDTFITDKEKSFNLKIYTHPLLPLENQIIETINDCLDIYIKRNDAFIRYIPILRKVNSLDTRKLFYEPYIELKQASEYTQEDTFNYD